MNDLDKAKSELQVLRSIVSRSTDSALRASALGKVNIIERHLKAIEKKK